MRTEIFNVIWTFYQRRILLYLSSIFHNWIHSTLEFNNSERERKETKARTKTLMRYMMCVSVWVVKNRDILSVAGSQRWFGCARSSHWRIARSCRTSAGGLRCRGPREGRSGGKWGRSGLGGYQGRIRCPLYQVSARVQIVATVQRLECCG